MFALTPIRAAQASDPPYVVSINTSATSIGLGSTVRIYGRVSPGAAGKTVRIQRHYVSTTWVTIAYRTLTSTSHYSKTIRPTPAGPTFYRVVKPASSSHSIGRSAAVRVNVFRWRYLFDIGDSVRGLTTVGSFASNGNTFAKSYSLEDGGDVSWDLHTLRCRKLSTLVGIDDGSPNPTIGSAQEEYFAGATSQVVQQVGLLNGQDPRLVQRDLGLYRDKVEFTATTTGPADVTKRVVFANPRVYCNS